MGTLINEDANAPLAFSGNLTSIKADGNLKLAAQHTAISS